MSGRVLQLSRGFPSVANEPVRWERIQLARTEDRDVIAALYEAYADLLFRVAFRLTGSWADSQDVAHEVFLGLPEALGTYEGRGTFEGWLVQLATRTALMKRRRRREVPYESVSWSAGQVAPHAAVDRLALDEAIGVLPDEQRAVFVLKILEGYSHEEIAGMLGISNGASRGRLFRAIRTLRRLLGTDQ